MTTSQRIESASPARPTPSGVRPRGQHGAVHLTEVDFRTTRCGLRIPISWTVAPIGAVTCPTCRQDS